MPRKYIIALVLITLLIVVTLAFITFSRSREAGENILDSIGEILNPHDFPDISYFKDNPTDVFLLKEEDFNRIRDVHPFLGKNSSCPHSGGHINYTLDGAPYEADIITPVDGVVSRVNTCFDLGVHDKFDIGIDFATYQGDTVSLDYSIEPFDGLRCKTDPDYYKKYILVEQGQEVKAGDVIAIMPKFSSDPNTGTHIHFNLSTGSQMVCPNIFSDRVTKAYGAMYGGATCGDQIGSTPTFCFMPGEGEDIVGL